MKIETRDLGVVEIKKEDIITFSQGIPGFINQKEFVILKLDKDSPFFILQSVSEPELAFITLNPWNIIKDYEFEIKEGTEKQLKIESQEEILALVIGTIREKLENMTVNLAAPLIINIKARLGKQVILENSKYPVRFKVFRQDKQVAGEC